MKNFRKSIIALATAAAMLIPSVAMAATFTTEVESSKIATSDNVYVGFYDENEVLKEVVKTTVGEVAVADTKLQAADLPVTVTVENSFVRNRASDNAAVYKLSFIATGDDYVTTTGIMFSYDNTVIQPVNKNTKALDVEASAVSPYKAYQNPDGESDGNFNLGTPAVATEGNRTAVSADSLTMYPEDYDMDMTDGAVFLEFYYRVLEGKTVTADTFKLETTGSLAEKIGNPGDSKAITLGTDYWYGRVKDGVAQEDTISFGGFPFAPAEEEIEMTTLTVSTEKNVAGYKAKMFIWDADQIAKVAPIELN